MARNPTFAPWGVTRTCNFAPNDQETGCRVRRPVIDFRGMRRRRSPIEDLRTAIDCLPVHTRTAMLEGVRQWPIIVGAYTDRRGGVCPMLAAHRCGGRADLLALSRGRGRRTPPHRPPPAPPR